MCCRIRRNILSMGKLYALILVAALSVIAAPGASAQSLEVAPLNPAFEAWRDGLLPQAKSAEHPLGYIPVPWQQTQVKEEPTAKAFAPSFDLRTLGEVTAVRNQGSCGACWTFATYAAAESGLLKSFGETWDFSENNLKNYHGFDYTPCAGGNEYMSCAYLARGAGPVLEEDDPYSDSDDRPSPGGPKAMQMESMLRFATSAQIKEALMTAGALATKMYWDEAYYNPSDYTYYFPSGGTENHGVTIVGWDDNKVVTGGPSANPQPGAWIIKNSWGSSWGESGYFYISYYDGVAVVPSGGGYAFSWVPETQYGNIYQHDTLGKCSTLGFSSDTCWGANVFTATADENLTSVAFYTTAPNTTFTVNIYGTVSGSSFSNLLGSVSGTQSFEGYHTVPLTSPIALTSGNQFAIVLRVTSPGQNYPMAVEHPVAAYSTGVVVHASESYFSSNGINWQNPSLEYNACIKGLTEGALESDGTINVTDSIQSTDDHQLPFAGILAGWSASEHIVIENTDLVTPLSISSIDIQSDNGLVPDVFTVANAPSLPVTLAPGRSLSVYITFAPTSVGSFESTLSIISSDLENPSVAVSLTGEAIGGELPAAGAAALVLLGGAMAALAAIKNRRRE